LLEWEIEFLKNGGRLGPEYYGVPKEEWDASRGET
jgi:hypothetical protein